jgi:hypothetical protein
MLKDNDVVTTSPTMVGMVAFVYSSRHKKEVDISEMLGENKRTLIDKNQSNE